MIVKTLNIELEDKEAERILRAAHILGLPPNRIIQQALAQYLDQIEHRSTPFKIEPPTMSELPGSSVSAAPTSTTVFLNLAQSIQTQSELRAAITAAYRRPEEECIPALLDAASLEEQENRAADSLARRLIETLRAKNAHVGREGLVQALLQEFALSSQEGIALMCLAEALLRIPDAATRDALIRDKIGRGDWAAHLGHSESIFVNAATWGLLITGKLVSTQSESGLSNALARMLARSGEPVVRKGVDMAMRLMGEQFVTGETITQALANAREFEAQGFRYSYDMLGEAALTHEDALRYCAAYEQAIHAIGLAAAKRGIYEGPGISIKLSALHPRYSRTQLSRVKNELYPRLLKLVELARGYDIGINLDAEETDRLEISLDLLAALCHEKSLEGWDGIGFVIQAYQKRAPFVIDFVIDLARRTQRRLMIRLVKGAYWDSEIKRAQVDGLNGYPVYTRKVHTDIAYLACARLLLAAPDAIHPQFATHNARTLASIYQMAGGNYYAGQYEFQCLHGMGEPLYEEVVGPHKLNRPCRIYAPVGSYETLLPYLVRRLLENGANTSFVNQIRDQNISIDELVSDPLKHAQAITPLGSPHPEIALPRYMFGAQRLNSIGFDLSNEQDLGATSAALLASVHNNEVAQPILADAKLALSHVKVITNPADRGDKVGQVYETHPNEITVAMANAKLAQPLWQATTPIERAEILEQAAERFEMHLNIFVSLAIREAGKNLPNAVGEVREAIDFLRYYAALIRDESSHAQATPLGPIVCISPWNFPLAIFTGQIAAALATGNVVLAKPAEQTPLIAAHAVRLLHEAGVPQGALQFLPGSGETIGAALVAEPSVCGVVFTGSTEVARNISRTLSQRLLPNGQPVPLIAETGGQNAMIVDSSALAEQVVLDVLGSAFDSAGQRCSALRVLCLQEEVADKIVLMLRGALDERIVTAPDRLDADIGPVIDDEAKQNILSHIENLRAQGCKVHQHVLSADCEQGSFVAPTIIEIRSLDLLKHEVFGPVLHVLRYRREQLPVLMQKISQLGYGLTMGLHTRIDETIGEVVKHSHVGNLYVNRNMIGAVVGVQPFGGEGLSGTGPKAGGPLYLQRFYANNPVINLNASAPFSNSSQLQASLRGLFEMLATQVRRAQGNLQGVAHALKESNPSLSEYAQKLIGKTLVGHVQMLSGPTGEANLYSLHPRGTVLCIANTREDYLAQLVTALATGNEICLLDEEGARANLTAILKQLDCKVTWVDNIDQAPCDVALYAGDSQILLKVLSKLSARPGAIVSCHIPREDARHIYPIERLLLERSLSINTAAAGGNASLMTVG